MTRVRKTTMHDESKRGGANWFAPIYVVDEGPEFRDLPEDLLFEIGRSPAMNAGTQSKRVDVVTETSERGRARRPNRCSPEHPCPALNETHVDMWGECFVSSYERMVSLGAEIPAGQVVQVASERPGDYCWLCGVVRDEHGSADHDLVPFPPEAYEETAGRPLFLTCWDCGHSVNREYQCHHCGSKLVRQGGHSLQPWCGCRHDAART